ncbi:conserved hypothetical protein [Ricinus communis]|uniref:Uncharacterized protein n=1 Tax=Ricinus communis TaxID=3988 RepID=B9T3E2_RICCO|nr:conserved hypothetical protein [Ricinus communis]
MAVCSVNYQDFTPKLADSGMVTSEGENLQSRTRLEDIYGLGVMTLQVMMKKKNASLLPGVRIPWHISEQASRIYLQQKHAVDLALITTGCTKRAATAIRLCRGQSI